MFSLVPCLLCLVSVLLHTLTFGWDDGDRWVVCARQSVLFLVRGGVSTYRWKAPFKGFLPVHMGVGLGLGLDLGLRRGLDMRRTR